ncbi:MAG: type II toxin-antitoxin system PrlF family antitoxin [Desulfuromonadales bacterium]|nr:type II toxin-antitoxin system PrlF family antitoxin [Desulfuromonadales bacterium]
MTTATSKITSKYQATIPEPVRKALHLKAGDAIAFDIEDHQIRIRKARPIDVAFAKALVGTLNEWESPADEEAYRDL